MFEKFYFLFKTQSDLNFSGLCEMIISNLTEARNSLEKMPQAELYAFKSYAENRGSVTAAMWTEAELKRREFLLYKVSLALSILAFFTSVIALAN